VLNALSNVSIADTTSTFLSNGSDLSEGIVDPSTHVGRSGAACSSSVGRAVQTGWACDLVKKIFDDEEAWLDPHERTGMMSAMAAVGLEMKGFKGTGVVVHTADEDGTLPPYADGPTDRTLHVIHAAGGSIGDVMVTTTQCVGVHRRFPPVGMGGRHVQGVAEALCKALTPSPARCGRPLSPGDLSAFERSLRDAMQRLAEDDPAQLLRLAGHGVRAF